MAPRSTQNSNPRRLVQEVSAELATYAASITGVPARDDVLRLIPIADRFREIGASLIDADSGKARMLAYLRALPATSVAARELEIVAGIGEWARRIRELRVQEGWPIFSADTLSQIATEDPEQAADIEAQTGVAIKDLEKESYVLLQDQRDGYAADTWELLNSIRKKKTAAKSKILEFLRANAGHAVSGEQLRYLAKGKTEWARRTRELRTEEGWPVQTRMQGRPDVPIGFYVLAEDRQAPPHDRKISDTVRSEVLKRDQFRCRMCHWSRQDAHPDDAKQYLELHHVVEHVRGGANTAENLVTLCNVDHKAVHAGTLTLPSEWP